MPWSRHRVAEHLLAFRKAEHEALAEGGPRRRGKIGLFNDPAPGDVAGIAGTQPGQERLADRREQAIGADQEFRLDLASVGEAEGDAAASVLDADHPPGMMQPRRGQVFPKEIVEAPPTRHDLRAVSFGADLSASAQDAAARHPDAD